MLNAVFSPIGFQSTSSGPAPNPHHSYVQMKGIARDPWALSGVCERSTPLPVQCRIKRLSSSLYASDSDAKEFNDNAAGS